MHRGDVCPFSSPCVVVDHTELLARQNLIGALDLLELFLVAALVGVVLDRKLAECLLDLSFRRLPAHLEHCKARQQEDDDEIQASVTLHFRGLWGYTDVVPGEILDALIGQVECVRCGRENMRRGRIPSCPCGTGHRAERPSRTLWGLTLIRTLLFTSLLGHAVFLPIPVLPGVGRVKAGSRNQQREEDRTPCQRVARHSRQEFP